MDLLQAYPEPAPGNIGKNEDGYYDTYNLDSTGNRIYLDDFAFLLKSRASPIQYSKSFLDFIPLSSINT